MQLPSEAIALSLLDVMSNTSYDYVNPVDKDLPHQIRAWQKSSTVMHEVGYVHLWKGTYEAMISKDSWQNAMRLGQPGPKGDLFIADGTQLVMMFKVEWLPGNLVKITSKAHAADVQDLRGGRHCYQSTRQRPVCCQVWEMTTLRPSSTSSGVTLWESHLYLKCASTDLQCLCRQSSVPEDRGTLQAYD